MALMHEDFFTLGGIFTLAGFVVEEFYCISTVMRQEYQMTCNKFFSLDIFFLWRCHKLSMCACLKVAFLQDKKGQFTEIKYKTQLPKMPIYSLSDWSVWLFYAGHRLSKVRSGGKKRRSSAHSAMASVVHIGRKAELAGSSIATTANSSSSKWQLDHSPHDVSSNIQTTLIIWWGHF